MTAPATPFTLTDESQRALIQFCKKTQEASFNTTGLREKFEFIDKEYIRENNLVDEHAQIQSANNLGNKRKIQDIVIPIVKPQTDTALSYLTSVFLTGNPIFPIVSPDQQFMDQAQQMTAIVSENSVRGGWARELLLFFRDGLKYNFHAVEVDWCREKVYSPITDAKFSPTQAKPQEIIWQGNKLKRLDPYNIIWDPRVKITEQHKKAEFAGYTEVMNRVGLTEFLHSLPSRMNFTKALEQTPDINGARNGLYYTPNVFPQNYNLSKIGLVMNWDNWATGTGLPDPKIRYKNLYFVSTRYIRIIPADFRIFVPARNQCQIWKLITVNDGVIVYAERLTNAHNYLPIIFGQPCEDGLDLQTKSFAQEQIPMQDIASALANSKFAARRRLVADRGLYDPSRIREADINSDNPAAKIPVRPSAYGQPLEKAYYPIPFKDEQTATLFQDVREVGNYADYLSGQNKAQQGQFVKGNKSRGEFEDIQSKSSGRQQMMAIGIEYQVMVPVKEIIKLNILQYQPATSVYSYVDQKPYNIDPLKLREASLNFAVSDGLNPAEKILDNDTLSAGFQVIGTTPAIGQEYNIGDVFAYLMQTKGVNIKQFKYTPEQKQEILNQRLKAQQQQTDIESAGEAKKEQAKAQAQAQAQGAKV
jgi:hypothetical protein